MQVLGPTGFIFAWKVIRDGYHMVIIIFYSLCLSLKYRAHEIIPKGNIFYILVNIYVRGNYIQCFNIYPIFWSLLFKSLHC